MQAARANKGAPEEDLASIVSTCSVHSVSGGGGGGKKRRGGGSDGARSIDSTEKKKRAKKNLLEEFTCPLSGKLFGECWLTSHKLRPYESCDMQYICTRTDTNMCILHLFCHIT